MPSKTNIEWTDYSSNPIYAVDVETGKRGWWCTKVSPGCAHCYSARRNLWVGNHHDYLPANAPKVRFEVDERELSRIIQLCGTVEPDRNKVFMCDMTDLFHEGITDEQISRVFDTMAACEGHLTFQVLTKRPERALEWFGKVGRRVLPDGTVLPRHLVGAWPWPLSNVWFGVSVENQFWAERRIPLLTQIPAAIRFLSCEPLLGPLDLHRWLDPKPDAVMVSGAPSEGLPDDVAAAIAEVARAAIRHLRGIHWVIAGGESAGPERRRLVDGPVYDGYRPRFDARVWVDDIRTDCADAGVPFFWKQWGGPRPTSGGRLLHGREYNQMPRSLGNVAL